MKKKYIIDLNPDCVEGEYLRIPARIAGEEQWLVTKAALTPYTEPDLEQVRKEAYAEGRNSLLIEVQKAGKNTIKLEEDEYYQRGLSDAWDAARKIVTMPNRDFINSDILDLDPGESIFTKYTASEAIEKIRQYEQEQEEIKVGDEVKTPDGQKMVVAAIVHNDYAGLADDGRFMFGTLDGSITKTGRHFPEIATVLKKMRGEQE